MSEYTQGVCHDGAAILKDGQSLTIEQILEALQERETLVARIAELERYNLGLANESCELQERVARLNNALTRQANAATLGMNAAKAVASSELEQAKRLHAESSPAALESEREANAVLTERGAELEAHVERLREAASIPRLDSWMRILEIIDDAPATSLARRDVLKQAEALEEAAADTVPAMHKMKHWLLSRANDLRQQAEGHQ